MLVIDLNVINWTFLLWLKLILPDIYDKKTLGDFLLSLLSYFILKKKNRSIIWQQKIGCLCSSGQKNEGCT